MNVFNTHGYWTTLGRIRELEVEDRGNYFPDLPYPDDTMCIWVCIKAKDCKYYEPEIAVEDYVSIEVKEHHVLCAYDYNGGFLLLNPTVNKGG